MAVAFLKIQHAWTTFAVTATASIGIRLRKKHRHLMQQYLLTSSGRIIITMILALLATGAQAQFRRVITYQTVVGGNRIVDKEAFTFDSVDEEPHFPGGDGAMMKFINRERRYPAEAFDAGVQGRVLCSFICKQRRLYKQCRGVERSGG